MPVTCLAHHLIKIGLSASELWRKEQTFHSETVGGLWFAEVVTALLRAKRSVPSSLSVCWSVAAMIMKIVYLVCINNHTRLPIIPHTHRAHQHHCRPSITCGKLNTCIGSFTTTGRSQTAQGCWEWMTVSLNEFIGIWQNLNINEGGLGSNNNLLGKPVREKHKTETLLLTLTPWATVKKAGHIGVLACLNAQYSVYSIYTPWNISKLKYIQMLHAHIVYLFHTQCKPRLHSTQQNETHRDDKAQIRSEALFSEWLFSFFPSLAFT